MVTDWRHEAAHQLPRALEEVTPAWVTLAMRAFDASAPEVESVEIERIGEGFGLTGAIGRMQVRWQSGDGQLPGSVIVKLPLAQSGEPSLYRKRTEQGAPGDNPYFQRCSRETRFYSELASLGHTPAPVCYFAASSEDQVAIVLLLEDIEDARQGDVLAGCSLEDVAATIDAIASVHATWWTSVSASAHVLSWLPRWGDDPVRRHDRYRSQVGPFLERWGHTMVPEIVDLIRLMETRYGAVLTSIDELLRSAIHADLHLDNLLFVGTGNRPRVVVLDWQSVCSGPIAVDLSTLITGSLSPGDLRRGIDELTEHYADALEVNAGIDYPAAHLMHDLRLALLWRLGGTVGWLSNADVDQMTGRERDLVMAALGDGRLANALVDLDARSLLMKY